MPRGMPWMPWYPDDWSNDACLRLCRRESRSWWVDALGFMHKHSPKRGYLLLQNGKAPTVLELARLFGDTPGETEAMIADLEHNDVFSRTSEGVIYSRRMVREDRKRASCVENGSKRWQTRIGADPEVEMPRAMRRSERLAEARQKGKHSKAEWDRLVKLCGGKCLKCGSDEVVKDHVVPLFMGGSDAISNLQPLCVLCNSTKGSDQSDFVPPRIRAKFQPVEDRTPAKTPAKTPATADGTSANALVSDVCLLDSSSEEGVQREEGRSIERRKKTLPCEPEDVAQLWNEVAGIVGLPQVEKLTDGRLRKLGARLREDPERTLDWWRSYFERIATSPFCRGEVGDRGWKADLDWAIKSEEVVARVLEGAYDRRATAKPETQAERIARFAAEARAKEEATARAPPDGQDALFEDEPLEVGRLALAERGDHLVMRGGSA